MFDKIYFGALGATVYKMTGKKIELKIKHDTTALHITLLMLPTSDETNASMNNPKRRDIFDQDTIA